MHWLAHIWLWFFILLFAYIWQHNHRKGNHMEKWFFSGVAVIALLFVWSWFTVFDLPPGAKPDTRTRADFQKERFEKAGIVCAEDMDNDSGNVCRTKLGDEECIAILPDDDTKTSFNKKDLFRCTKGD